LFPWIAKYIKKYIGMSKKEVQCNTNADYTINLKQNF